MEIRTLKYFLMVAKTGNITKAANYMHLTQPTLSRQLFALEKDLGQKLFIRKNHRITLTYQGLIFKKRAEEIIELVQKTENEFLFSNDEFAGNIFIGSGETHSIKIISEIIKSLNKDFPKIKFHIISGDSEDLLERLDKGLLDFCILIEPYNLDNYEYLDLNQKDVWGLLFRKDDKLAQKNFIKIEDLFNIPLLISRQVIKKSFDNNPILNWFGDNLDKLNIIGTYNLIYNAAVMTENKICCALGLDRLITDSIDSPLTFRPLFPIVEVKVSIVWKKNQIFSSPAKLFLKKLQDTLK